MDGVVYQNIIRNGRGGIRTLYVMDGWYQNIIRNGRDGVRTLYVMDGMASEHYT